MQDTYQKRGYLLEDFRLFHLGDSPEVRIDYHYHEFCKLLLLISGSGGYWVEGQQYRLQAGDAVLIGSRRAHRPEFDPAHPCERVILYISPEFLHRFSTADCNLGDCFSDQWGHVLRLEGDARERLFSMVAELEQELSADGYGRVAMSSCLLVRLLVELGRTARRGGLQSPAPLSPKDKRIQQMLRYIEAHLAEDLSIDDLAERFFLSKYHMMRLFRAETGSSVHVYLTDRRLLLARDLMRQGMSATQACFHSGFRSYSSFTRAYAKRFGTTPTGRTGIAHIADETFE